MCPTGNMLSMFLCFDPQHRTQPLNPVGVGGVGGSAHLIHLLDGPTVPHHMGSCAAPHTHTHTLTKPAHIHHVPKCTRHLHTHQKHLECRMLWPWLPPPLKTLNQPYGPSDPRHYRHPSLQQLGFLITRDAGSQMSQGMSDEQGLGGQLHTGAQTVKMIGTWVGG